MSQNFMYDKKNDLVLMTGWDKPMQEAYIMIGRLDAAGEGWKRPMLVDETTPFNRDLNMQYVGEIVVRYSGVARRHGIQLTDSIKDYLINHITENTVNVIVLHSVDAPPEVLEDTPFSTQLFRKRAP